MNNFERILDEEFLDEALSIKKVIKRGVFGPPVVGLLIVSVMLQGVSNVSKKFKTKIDNIIKKSEDWVKKEKADPKEVKLLTSELHTALKSTIDREMYNVVHAYHVNIMTAAEKKDWDTINKYVNDIKDMRNKVSDRLRSA